MAQHTPHSRRTVLECIGATVVGSAAFSAAGTATEPAQFPSGEHTAHSDPQSLGNGEVSTFTTTTPSGEPTYVGVTLSAGALDGLPTASAVADSDRGVEHHGLWSKPYRLSLPETAPSPFEYVGFAWNPEGHTPRGVWNVPHFDVHFYFEPPATVSTIEAGVIEDLPAEIVPDGYRLAEDGAVVPKMGGHLAPEDAPEFAGGTFTNTLIWGVADLGDGPQLHFVEPMVTRAYLGSLGCTDRQSIPQPETYPTAGRYPTAYSVRPLESGGYAVALEAFQERSG